MGSPANKIERAHQMYRDGSYEEALGFYTEALSVAKKKPQKIALHSNRAACYLKLHDFKKAAQECTSVLELDHKHTGALMLRAQTLVTLKEYHSALFDVNRLIEMNPSSEVYQNLQACLKTQLVNPCISTLLRSFLAFQGMFSSRKSIRKLLIEETIGKFVCFFGQGKSLAPIPESEAEFEEEEEEPCTTIEKEEEKDDEKEEDAAVPVVPKDNKSEPQVKMPKTPGIKESSEPGIVQKAEPKRNNTNEAIPLEHSTKKSTVPDPKGWQAIPKPKGHSALDYARWDRVEDDSSEDDGADDDDEDSQPQYRFRVRTVGVRPVK